MRKIATLDDTDVLILKTLSMYPMINQVELAKKIGLTQPAVSGRLRKLISRGMLSEANMQVSSKALGLKMVKIDMQVKNGSNIFEKFRECPIIAESYLHDNNGMCMIVVGESSQFLSCFVSEHLEKNDNVANIRIETITESLHGFRTSMDMHKKLDIPPCGDHPCNECEYYIDNGGQCVGCPMTKFYKGKMWIQNIL
ncbi:MAG: winged helix-turn-helix transcriptional regulator [Nitrososphaerales archaeon]